MKSYIYTRSGDKGETSLIGGARTGKDSNRIEAYGDVDELSSALGFVGASTQCTDEIKGELQEIQHILFEIGACLATPDGMESDEGVTFLDEEIRKMEGWIDAFDERLPQLRSFILPGGCEGAARCHMARTICRRTERKIIALSRESEVDLRLIAYINRLSDYLFVACRYINFINGVEETAWQKRGK